MNLVVLGGFGDAVARHVKRDPKDHPRKCYSRVFSFLFFELLLLTPLIAACVALAIAASLLLVPAVRAFAHFVGMVDRPDNERKLHNRPIALGGGLAVFLAVIVAFALTVLVDQRYGFGVLGEVPQRWYFLFLAAGAILVVGLIDDVWELRGRQKLLLQLVIIVALVASGSTVDESVPSAAGADASLVASGTPIASPPDASVSADRHMSSGTSTVISEISILGFRFHLGILAFPLTILWLLVSVNALNLIDGADGVATTAGCIICAGLGFLSFHSDNLFCASVAFALSGSLLGFLVFNRPPATIFLGDAGSMMIGLFIGVLALWSSFKESTVLASAPVAILAIPLFDSTAAVVRRWLTGRSIYATDRAHLHHLLEEKFGRRSMLLVVAGLCATTTSLAVLSIVWEQPWLAALGVVIVFCLLVMTRSFGHAECRLLMGRASHFARSFATGPAKYESDKHHRRVPLQGVGRWETIWEPLVEFAKTHELAGVKVDLNLAWLHEGYHATWQSIRLPEKSHQLSICVPLFTFRAADQIQVQIGRLEIIAAANDPSVYQRIADLADKLADLGPQIDMIVAHLESRKQLAALARVQPVVADHNGSSEVMVPVLSEGRVLNDDRVLSDGRPLSDGRVLSDERHRPITVSGG